MPRIRTTVVVVANAAKIAAMLAPVPCLSTAASMVISMVDLYDKVRFNRHVFYSPRSYAEVSESALQVNEFASSIAVAKGFSLLSRTKPKGLRITNQAWTK